MVKEFWYISASMAIDMIPIEMECSMLVVVAAQMASVYLSTYLLFRKSIAKY